MSKNQSGWFERAALGAGSSPAQRLEVDRLLRRSAPIVPPPAGLRRSILARVGAAGAAPSSRAAAAGGLLGRIALGAALCGALAIAVIAMRPGARPGVGSPAVGPTRPSDRGSIVIAPEETSTPSPRALALVEQRLRDSLRNLPTRVEAPLRQEAERIAMDTRRAFRVVSAGWRVTRAEPAGAALPGGAPADGAGNPGVRRN